MQKNLLLKIKYFIYTGRYDKPTGALLLMFPCFWGLAYNINLPILSIKYFFFFLLVRSLCEVPDAQLMISLILI